MKRMIMVLVFLLLTGFVVGEKVVTLNEVVNVNSLTYPLNVDDNNIYICDGIKVLIYSAKDFKLKKMFGKAGEGPREFKGYEGGTAVITMLSPDYILVDSVGKLSYFTKEGVYVKEIKTMNGAGFSVFGDKFIGESRINEDNTAYATINLYDSTFKKLTELARVKAFALQNKINIYEFRRPRPIVYNNKLYIIDFSDGSIAVYDHNGKKLHTLKHNYDKVEVIEAHKQDTINSIKNDVRFKQYAELLIPRLSFPRYFPAVKYCHIADNKIYLLTYAIVDKKSQFIVLNLKGKLLKKIYFPLANVSFYEPYSYTIYKNKLYQLVDNERAEAWDIHIYDFK